MASVVLRDGLLKVPQDPITLGCRLGGGRGGYEQESQHAGGDGSHRMLQGEHLAPEHRSCQWRSFKTGEFCVKRVARLGDLSRGPEVLRDHLALSQGEDAARPRRRRVCGKRFAVVDGKPHNAEARDESLRSDE